MSELGEVCFMRGLKEHRRSVTFPPTTQVGHIACPECGGTGWWGYGPTERTNRACIDCNGTGRVWVGLW